MAGVAIPSDLDIYRALRACMADRDVRYDKETEARKRDDWGYHATTRFCGMEELNEHVDHTWQQMDYTLYRIRLHDEERKKMENSYNRQLTHFHRHVTLRAAQGFDDTDDAPEGEALRQRVADMMRDDVFRVYDYITRKA